MKVIMINGKEYMQLEDSDIAKLPSMTYPHDLLKYNQPERLNPRDHIEDNLEMVCDSPISTNK